MKICFLLNHFLPHQVAGTEIYTFALAKSLQQMGHNIVIIIPNYDTNIDAEYWHEGLRVARYAEPNTRTKKISTGREAPLGLQAFERLIKKENPSIVNIQELNNSTGISLFHLEVLHRLGMKVFVTFHLASYTCYTGTLMYKDKMPCDGKIKIAKCTRCSLQKLPVNSFMRQMLYYSSMPLFYANINTSMLNSKAGTAFSFPFIIKNMKQRLQKIVDYASGIIVLTDWFKEVLLLNDVPGNKISLVKQGLPFKETEPVSNEKKSTLIKLIFVGRIYPAKGIEVLLQAMESVDENIFDLDIYGENAKNNYQKELKNKTAAKKNIHWKGILQPENVVNILRSYHAVIIPSIVCEMAPLLIQQAFAAGVPVIGSDVKGIAEQIKNEKNGWLFPMGNALELQKKIKHLANTENTNAVVKNIKPPRSFDEISKETIALFESVLPVKSLSTS